MHDIKSFAIGVFLSSLLLKEQRMISDKKKTLCETIPRQGSKLATNWSHMRLDFWLCAKNSCVIAPVRHKTQSTVWLTCFRLYLQTQTRKTVCVSLVFSINGFHELECTFSFRCFTPSQTLLFCNKHRWHMQIYATNETRTFWAMDDHVERSVLTSIKTKTVRIKSLFFQVRKFFKSYSSYM